MNRLIAELQRLYFLHDRATGEFRLAAPDGRVRAAMVKFERAADWDLAARLYQGVRDELELPAPAVSISGGCGYQLWFSFSEPVTVDQASGFLSILRQDYLSEALPGHLKFWPEADGALSAPSNSMVLPPALDAESGKWSAFIEPSLGSMFVEEPGLEMAPNEERQADLLAGLKSIQAGELQRVLALFSLQSEAQTVSQEPADTPPRNNAARSSGLNVGGGFSDPKRFLLAVMNDPTASADHRIEAAKALLPYFDNERHG